MECSSLLPPRFGPARWPVMSSCRCRGRAASRAEVVASQRTPESPGRSKKSQRGDAGLRSEEGPGFSPAWPTHGRPCREASRRAVACHGLSGAKVLPFPSVNGGSSITAFSDLRTVDQRSTSPPKGCLGVRKGGAAQLLAIGRSRGNLETPDRLRRQLPAASAAPAPNCSSYPP